MLADDYDLSAFTHEDGVAALHVAAMLLDAKPSAAGHMVSIGAVPIFLSRYAYVNARKWMPRGRCVWMAA